MINIPNVLTFIRVLLTPFVIYFLAHRETQGMGLTCFALAALTDGLDGLTARAFGMMTRFGQLFDPIADKILMGGTFVTLAWIGIVPWWYFTIVVVRDVGIMLTGFFLLKHIGVDVKALSPNWLGKASTAMQICLVALLIATVPMRIAHFLIDVSAVLLIASGAHYAAIACKLFAHRPSR